MYVYSTVTASIAYTVGDKTIVIKGGANVADKHLWTPKGVATKVTREELDGLRNIPSFAKREENGYFSTSQFEKNPSKVAGDMAGADKSAQADVEKLEEKSKAKKK